MSTSPRVSVRAAAPLPPERPSILERLFGQRPPGPAEILAGPLRGELLGTEDLAARATALARSQRTVAPRYRARKPLLLARLASSSRILEDSHARLAAAADADVDVGPAGDWLLDNFHVIREHIQEVRESLPAGYYRELPELTGGLLAGYPRIYELTITLISHSEGRVDLENTDLFVAAFQKVSPLKLGELWALPAMLRLGLIESVRRMTLRTVQRLDEIEAAERACAEIEAAGELGEDALTRAVHSFVASPRPLTPIYISQFLHRLRLRHGALPLLEHWIAAEAMTAEQAAAQATQRLAITQVVMANSITSLRAVDRVDWKTLVERRSAVESVLREDPAHFYDRMTFATRDRYRHVVERIARGGGGDETEVARAAIGLALAASREDGGRDAHRSHVGYWLVDEGVTELERTVPYRARVSERVHRWVLRHPNTVFVGGMAVGTAAALAAVFWLAGPLPWSAWLGAGLLTAILANDVAVGVVNQLVAAYLPPRTLPKLDLREGGIPPELHTAVVVPTLFPTVGAVQEALEHLEVQFLANREENLHFALLSDFTDAATEVEEGDAAIVAAAVEGVKELNARYGRGGTDAFYLLHRPRRWNPAQGVWMGWERKRGKLAEFNRFVRGRDPDAFSVVVGDVESLRRLRYVITLDADTVLPPSTAALMIGAIAHPLNRAVYDPKAGRVTRGYGILQPRVGVSLPSAHASRFATIHSGHPGVDPYTSAVSDVYQDLYGEGSYTGKGIYDLDAFEEATHGRFPENALLSHDLIEGSYARAGLATDLTLYDDYPARYLTHARRKHRWIRGDWQLLRWLGRKVPGPEGPEPNRLSMLSQWKIVDNLRRSTLEVAQLGFIVAGWTVFAGSPLRWTVLGLLAIAAPWIVALLLAALRPPMDRSWRAYYRSVGNDAVTSAKQIALAVSFLPHQAWISADAIGRTLWRLFVSRRNLLEWQTASSMEATVSYRASTTWQTMGPAVGLGVLLGGVALATAGGVDLPLLLAVLPLTLLWAASPIFAHVLGAPPSRDERRLEPEATRQALRYALLHWNFFERFVTEETHGLAPDNFQEDPEPVVAMRTSPTNIGLQLLATTSAYDLGFLSVREMTRRVELTFRALERMRRYRGHFYNWYDLEDLSVLEPAYVSTVDSGNLGGHLLALRQACLSIPDGPVVDGRVERALEAAGTLAPAPEWAAWRQRRLEEHRAWLETVGVRAATAGDAAVEAVPTLRELADGSTEASQLVMRLDALARRAERYAMEMDFRFLFDEEKDLFSIGYQQGNHALDPASYDLLASEARLASFLAIAKNDVPAEHWFSLGRTLTRAGGQVAMVSWSGSMFEYLMPMLVMRSLPSTLLDHAMQGAVRRQITYAAERKVPWGTSESAYNFRDRHFTYQYRAFGVPDLALKRGMGRDLVVAPYASALAVMVEPGRALANLASLEEQGALGPYGFRDAIDYTRSLPAGRGAVVGAYMAHHVGMTLVALANVLEGSIWQARFHADPLVRSAELLLHERLPRRLVFHKPHVVRADESLPKPELEQPAVREIHTVDTPQPHVALLGRLPYTVMVSHCGSGYSRFRERAVTRWRADGTLDDTGQFCYLRDVSSGRVWSAAHQPVCARADVYHALLATDRVTFHRVDGDLETRTEIAAVPEDAAEVRRVTVTNNGAEPREVELTSYGEVVLATPDADRAHPAFSNLFVETEWHEWCAAITATRRPRSADETPLWCVHVVDAGKERVGPVTCETDRSRFLGRGRSTRDPVALETEGALSGTVGAVLDPIFALRTRLALAPEQTASVTFTTLVAESRARAFELAGRYHDPHAANRALELAWTSAQVELREMAITPTDAAVFQEIAGHLLYSEPAVRVGADEMLRNRGSRRLLWANGISGDRPIVLATVGSTDGLPTLRQLFAAQRFWHRRGMAVDLVVVDTQSSSYLRELSDQIAEAIVTSGNAGMEDRPGGIFVRKRDLLAADDLLMLRATARVHIPCDGRSLGRIFEGMLAPEEPEVQRREPAVRPRAPERRSALHRDRRVDSTLPIAPDPAPAAGRAAPPPGEGDPRRALDPTSLQFDNGIGGVTQEGDYQIRILGDRVPPAPWSNVVATRHGGFVVTERGGGFTWAENSYFYRLTPWHNDPVADPVGEALYLRDEATGEMWSATPAPVPSEIAYTVHHGAGWSSFAHEHTGLITHLTLAMAPDEAVKISLLRITNETLQPRRLSVTAYVEWTLGVHREHTQHQVRTGFDAEHEAILARNFFDPDFAGKVAFCSLSEPLTEHTGDRREFLGRNRTLADPAGLGEVRLSGLHGAGIDPCAALRCGLELAPGETREVVVVLGALEGEAEALRAVAEYRELDRARAAISAASEGWDERLSVVKVRTPEPSFDVMVNRWTLYQALACRMWARSALYQSSGAYGFRDQLQDAMAFLYAEPAVAREHILRAAARQFLEGDVQHWWHPHSGRGVRTRFSDDLAWLPHVVDRYVSVTGDASVLDEYVPFLTMRDLEPHEHEVYDLPSVSEEHGSVWEHCLRALRRACTTGEHGLPLIGSGDWNDGMNRVGVEGRGESIWLAWFLTATLRAFAVQAEARRDDAVATDFRARADAYVAAIEAYGWDGAWYRRAYFDDGTPLGSATSDECRIDSIAQSWSVISGAGRPDRQARAMQSLETHLVDDGARILMLLTPPFDRTPRDPGYIKGYLPGVRENGAQYTHAALWAVLATALSGHGDRAFQLYQMINPLTRTRTPEEIEIYQGEPYVVAADVYTAAGHLGRAGWTWYTGSASWMYRVGLEGILGFRKRGDLLFLEPVTPDGWDEFTIEYRYGRSLYTISVQDPPSVRRLGASVSVDGREQAEPGIRLVDDGATREVVVRPLRPAGDLVRDGSAR
jgi:cyclic beta-1,2-glucan synthetase